MQWYHCPFALSYLAHAGNNVDDSLNPFRSETGKILDNDGNGPWYPGSLCRQVIMDIIIQLFINALRPRQDGRHVCRRHFQMPWWCHQMETFSALLAPGEFPAQRPVTRSFDVFFDLRLHGRLSKQSSGWWFETPSWSLWRQCNGIFFNEKCCIMIKISLRYVCRVSIDNNPALVQIMAWRRTGDKPLSEPIMA